MAVDWQSFWSSLLGTTIPGLAVSLFLLWLNNKNAKKVESYKSVLARSLAELQHQLASENMQVALWHQKRIAALIEIYEEFRVYVDFLRRKLYFGSREPLDPIHNFRAALDKNLLFLDDELQQFVTSLSGELLQFWNWALRQNRDGDASADEVQRRLDYEIPLVLERLRKRVNASADPNYQFNADSKPNSSLNTDPAGRLA